MYIYRYFLLTILPFAKLSETLVVKSMNSWPATAATGMSYYIFGDFQKVTIFLNIWAGGRGGGVKKNKKHFKSCI